MQVNATLIAAQQVAREAQARFQAAHATPKPPPATDFAAALDEGNFKPLALKQTAAPEPLAPATSPANAAPAARPGSLLDIKV